MITDEELRLAMRAGYFAIVNNKKFEVGCYANGNGQSINFYEAAKILLCKAEGLDPDEVTIEVNGRKF